MKRFALLAVLLFAGTSVGQEYSRGLKIPDNINERIAASWHKHGERMRSLQPVTASNYDTRTLGLVGPIKDQMDCGSCYGFAGIFACEGGLLKANYGKPDGTLGGSEQSVLDCMNVGGCDGGWPEDVIAWCKKNGMPLYKTNGSDKGYGRQYTGRSQPCLGFSGVKMYPIADYGYVGSDSAVPSTQAIKDAMVKFGPLAVAVAADNAFSNYRGGIFAGSGSKAINHAVGLVGWDDAAQVTENVGAPGIALPKAVGKGVWIMRNSWSTGWGENGYMRIAYGANKIGYGAIWASAVALPPTPTPPDPVPPDPVPPTPPPPVGVGKIVVKISGIPDQVMEFKIPAGSTVAPGSIILSPEQGKLLIDLLNQQKMEAKPPCKTGELEKKVGDLAAKFEAHRTKNASNIDELIAIVADNAASIKMLQQQVDSLKPKKSEPEQIKPPAKTKANREADTVEVIVKLPPALADAVVYMDGKPTASRGAVRTFITAPLPTDERYTFEIVAVSVGNPATYSRRHVAFRKNETAVADFTK